MYHIWVQIYRWFQLLCLWISIITVRTQKLRKIILYSIFQSCLFLIFKKNKLLTYCFHIVAVMLLDIVMTVRDAIGWIKSKLCNCEKSLKIYQNKETLFLAMLPLLRLKLIIFLMKKNSLFFKLSFLLNNK